jgi:hypothetical protein
MTGIQAQAHSAGYAPGPNSPHVFVEQDVLPLSRPIMEAGDSGYVPPPTPGGVSQICGLCGKDRENHLHIEGEAQADAESPRWGM